MTTNPLREMFLEECDELLEAMSDGLVELEAGTHSDDTINSVFRSVHSIKGGAGAFGMAEVVSFAHRFETVMDRLRGGQLHPELTLIGVLQRAGDHLTALIENARQGNVHSLDDTAALLSTLDQYLPDESLPTNEPKDADTSFEFEAVTLDLGFTADEEPAAAGSAGFCITFAPRPELYLNGHDPALLFAALSDLGDLHIDTDTASIPDLDNMTWDGAFLKWTLTLRTSEAEHTIDEVFEFVEGLCDISIKPLSAKPPQTVLPAISEAIIAAAPDPQPIINDTKPATASGPKATLRVDLDRVDRLINTVGELIINQAMIAQRIDEVDLPAGTDLQSELDAYQSLAREIQEGVMAIRAQPVKPLFQRMSRIVREAVDATGKKVKLVTDGEATEVDKTVIERIADPLTHMIRNAVDHGIETPQYRTESGKSETGTIHLSASHRSGSVVIEIRDDGAGLNREKILSIAMQKQLIAQDADLSDSEIDQLLFMPGFSTATEVSSLSGRGVGMDVVKNSITNLGGRVSISSQPGNGSTFSISLPLTLAVLDGMVVHVAGQVMIIPLSSILETVQPLPEDLHAFGKSSWMLRIRDLHVPIYDIGTQLGLRDQQIDYTTKVLILVESEDHGQIVLAVDDISDQRQVVIKGMQANYGTIPGISAATILGDGKIALILDPETLATDVSQSAAPPPKTEVPHAASA